MILLILVCTNLTFFGIAAHGIRKVQSETSAVNDAGISSRLQIITMINNYHLRCTLDYSFIMKG